MHLKKLTDIKVNTTIANLQKNQMEGYFVKNTQELFLLLEDLIPSGNSVGFGGSVTIESLGIIEWLRNRDLLLFDRQKESLTRSEIEEIFIKSLTADCFITSSNAITQNGQLYNIDGNGNRVSAMIYGPKSVIVIAGINKIVPSLEEAKKRLEEIAAPANAIRLNKDTPCAKVGRCMYCSSPQRICSSYVVLGWQQKKGRIKVILVDDTLGF